MKNLDYLLIFAGFTQQKACIGTKPINSDNFKNLFEEALVLSFNKTCANAQYITPEGKVIQGGFDINFLLNIEPNGQIGYTANGYFQHAGTTYSGGAKENYNMYAPYTNAPVMNFGITESTDAAFIDFINPLCKK